jgi:sarcosine oxidase subunit delta
VLLIRCPWCGERPELEFRHCGEAHLRRPADPDAVSDGDWTDFLHLRENPRGWHRERWRHSHGCGRFFNAIRHTLTDTFDATYPPGAPPPPLPGG